MSTLLDSGEPKQRRKSKPKSRSGCSSCKQRRLKCDERKPKCVRCEKSLFHCEYRNVGKPSGIGSRAPRVLALRPAAPLMQGAIRPSLQFLTETEYEKRYIHYSMDKSTSGFQGMVDWSLWNRLLMQYSHQEPFVRDFIVAIGALLKSIEAPPPHILERSPEYLETAIDLARMHKEYAFRKYGKAVRVLQTQITSSEPRQLLFACLLVFFFEMLLNNRHIALPQIIEGHRLLKSYFARAAPAKGQMPLLLTSPGKVEDELVDAFEHLDLQVCTVYDIRPLDFHNMMLLEGLELIKQMPSKFDNLTEARRFLNVIMSRVYHFLATTWKATGTSVLTHHFFTMKTEGVAVSSGANIFSTSYSIPESLPVEQQVYVEEHCRWMQAFDSVFRGTRSPELIDSREFFVATIMQIHAIGTEIVLAGVLFTQETSYDRFIPKFRQMLQLCDIVVNAYRKRETRAGPEDMAFSVDLGLTPQLFLLLLRCRDHRMRRHAISILDNWYTEACWNPRLIAQIGIFIMETETEGEANAGEPIPETSRAILTRICEVTSRSGSNEVLMQCVQRYGGPDGGPVWKEKLATYVTDRKTFTGE